MAKELKHFSTTIFIFHYLTIIFCFFVQEAADPHALLKQNDINIHKVKFNSSGREATVHMENKGEKKYIEMYEQGTSKGYNYKIDLKDKDIENARLICEAFKRLSSHCSENL